MKRHYYGFCFDGVQKVYNQFTVLNFLWYRKFVSYWMLSGSIKVIADYMKDRSLTVEQFVGMPVDEDFASSPGEIETTPPEGFLYQAGYLTLRADPFAAAKKLGIAIDDKTRQISDWAAA